MPPFPQLALGLLLALLVAAVAWVAGSLARSGALAAVLVGGLVFGFGGLPAAILLLTFFVSSSLLSAHGRGRKRSLVQEFAKDSRRDGKQVLANGAAAMIGSIAYGLSANPLWLAGVAGALAAATADTWATELGVLAASKPRRISDWRPVPAGTSGGVTLEGSAAAVAGAVILAALAWWMAGSARLAITTAAGGVLGALVDSFLGATLQARYRCAHCRRETERHPQHHCGQRTEFVAGWRRLGNDGVNLLATGLGCASALALFAALA